MNPLETLKEKMKIKPKIEERKPVAVIINVQEKAPKIITKMEGNIEEIAKEDDEPKTVQPKTTIKYVDEREKGYDRTNLINKLTQNRLKRVTIKKPALYQPELEAEVKKNVPTEMPEVKKATKITKQKIVIEDDSEEKGEKEEQKIEQDKGDEGVKVKNVMFEVDDEGTKDEEVIILKPEKKKRMTKKVEKGVAIIGPETIINVGDVALEKRLPKREQPINIKVSSYYMNNREKFINFINSLFEPYKREIEQNEENITCDTIGNIGENLTLLTHQKIVRDYMNLYTPYRGLLLYHGLGSGKTCSSIAIAEGMKEAKRVIIMTPASLQANYREQLKKCGDLIYKKNQYWEWISTEQNPDAAQTLSAVLNLPLEYIRRHKGAWFINIKKKSNYEQLNTNEKKMLELQIDEMIRTKYTFINYNGLRLKKLEELTSNFTKNLFDDTCVIIDEAHNLISRIVNKIKKEKPIKETERGEKDTSPKYLATKLYEYLLSAKNARIVLLSGTPVINYPNEFAILFNILRGYIKTWEIPLDIKTSKKVDKNALSDLLVGEKSLDYLDYSPSSKILTITRNPFGFKNKIKKESGYQGVSNVKKDEKGSTVIETEFISDDDFERRIISILRKNDIEILASGIKIRNKKALPDSLDAFSEQYINDITKEVKNVDALKRRILGLSSYFRSAQESLLPKYNKTLGVDYHIIRIPMSNLQFKIYESARREERKTEKPSKQQNIGDIFKGSTSTYRIFSRLFCNFVMESRPMPKDLRFKVITPTTSTTGLTKNKDIEEKSKNEEERKEAGKEDNKGFEELLKELKKTEESADVNTENEGEVEGDQILEKIGGDLYEQKIKETLKMFEDNSNDYLTPEALQTYSPKFLHMLENITDSDHQGLHLIYSQFRTLEGIGIFSLVLKKNGFAQFKIVKNGSGVWEIDINEEDKGKPCFALYTGTETAEEKEIIRNIYNGEWNYVPTNIANELRKIANNNNMGEIIRVFMITSSGSEGINLRNTRYVHIMEPYWHPVRVEQVIGRALRICSHKDLPKALQTVEVFVYLMIFSEEQLKSDDAIELKRKDLSKSEPKVPVTSDQLLYEISEIKANLTKQLTDIVKESAFDCYIYSKGNANVNCVNFGEPDSTKFAYVPDYAEQQSDITAQTNRKKIEWEGKPITISGVKYVYKRVSPKLLNIYDYASYKNAINNPVNSPLQIGTLEINEKGEQVFKQLVV